MTRARSPRDPLYVASPNDFGGHFAILFAEDDGRAFAAAPCDTVMIELEEQPPSGLRWHVAQAPPGFIIASDDWIQDGTFTKRGARRVKYREEPLERRFVIELDYGAEPGPIELVLAAVDVPLDEYGFAVVPAAEIQGRWRVDVDDTDTSLLAQSGLPGRRSGEPALYAVVPAPGARERLSPLAESRR